MRPTRHFAKLFSEKKGLYPILRQQTALIEQASELLTYLVETTEVEKWQLYEREIKGFETQGDGLLTDYFTELFDHYFSPADRNQLQTLANLCDDFMDAINGCAKCFLLYLPEKIHTPVIDLCGYIHNEAEALCDLVSTFAHLDKDAQNLILQCDRITELEHLSDEAYEEYVALMFTKETDAVKLMKYKNIAEQLENTSDACKHISDHIRNMLLLYLK